MKNVVVFCEKFLPYSQSFIATQLDDLTRYAPKVLTTDLIPSDHARRHIDKCDVLRRSASGRAEEIILKTVGYAMPSLVRRLGGADLIHAHFGKNGYVVAPLARAARVPLVTTFHGYDATYAGPAGKVGGFNQKRYFAHGRKAMASGDGWSIAVSRFIEKRLLTLGFSPDRIFQHYIGIDLSKFTPGTVPRKKGRVVSVARFVEYKGHRFMIDALSRVAKAGIPVDLVMVGEGPLRGEIEKLARDNLPHVEVRDKQTPAEIQALLSEAELYLHGAVTLDNGHAEAFGLANLEAAAVGTPVVAFDSGGVGEAVLNGETGLLCPERNVVEMADSIARILTDRQLWAAFSGRSEAFVREHFDASRQTQRLEDIYDDVVSRHSRKG